MSLRKTRCSVTGSVWELHVIVLVTGDKTFLSRSNMTILRYSDPFVNQWKNCKNFLQHACVSAKVSGQFVWRTAVLFQGQSFTGGQHFAPRPCRMPWIPTDNNSCREMCWRVQLGHDFSPLPGVYTPFKVTPWHSAQGCLFSETSCQVDPNVFEKHICS